MSNETVYTLVPSTNRGRYALEDPVEGRDITGGDALAIQLDGRWIEGRVEHARLYAIARTGQVEQGYYFIARNGGICGLCVGMKVRLR
jgi:Domain of unknown function (DUF5348)